MSFDKETVKKISTLSRIEIKEEEISKTAEEFSKILDWMSQLNEVNTDNIEAITSASNLGLRQREDIVNDGNYQQDILENAPDKQDIYFAVPKVVE